VVNPVPRNLISRPWFTGNSDHALVGAYALDAVSDDERARFERHLATCPRCTEELMALSSATTQLAFATETTPPDTLRTALFAALDDVVQDPPEPAAVAAEAAAPARVARIRAVRTRQAIAVLALSCAVFGLAAGAFAWTTVRTHDRLTAAEDREHALTAVLGAADVRASSSTATSGGTVTAYYSAALGKSVIVGQGLGPLPAGRTYELWYLDGPGRPARPAGTSRFDTPGSTLVLAANAGHPAGLAVTVEPSSGSTQPTTAPIATLALTD
jgi:hypothetical protein